MLQIDKAENGVDFTIITNNNVNHTFNCKERGRLLTEYNFKVMANKNIKSAQDQLNNAVSVIHQSNIYQEENPTKNAFFQINNVYLSLTYKN